jgi:hypothetical protein
MQYKDFVLQLEAAAGGGYVARIIDSPFGTDKDVWALPFPLEEAESRLASIEKLLTRLMKREKDAAPRLAEEQLRLGRELHGALFTSKLSSAFSNSFTNVETLGAAGLRLRLDFDTERPDEASLAALPWELLYKADTQDYLGIFVRTPIVRYLETHRLLKPFAVDGPLRVLLAESEPEDLRPLDLATEQRRIKEALEEHPDVELHYLEQPDVNDVRTVLEDKGIHVLHFMGHGRFDQHDGEGGIAFVTSDGKSQDVSGKRLAVYLKGIPSLRLVVLSSCYGAALPRRQAQNLYASVAPALLQAGIPAIVAMQFPISDAAATAFSTAFYSSLAKGDPVDVAATKGRVAIYGEEETSQEWVTPALFMRVRDGRIIDRFAPRNPGPVRLGIRSFADTDSWGKGLEDRVDRFLGLEEYFDGRSIRDDAMWNQAIFLKLNEFLFRVAGYRNPLHVDFAAHATIAFAAGYCLDCKSGLSIRILQRQLGGTTEWTSQEGEPPQGPLWSDGEITMDDNAYDVALAVSVSRPVLDDVEAYVRRSGLSVRRIVSASLLPEPSVKGIVNGAHALELALKLERRIWSRSIEEREGVLHLFVAAPNAFVFFLGQLAKAFGRVQLYEHHLGSGKVGDYQPSMRLPPVVQDIPE